MAFFRRSGKKAEVTAFVFRPELITGVDMLLILQKVNSDLPAAFNFKFKRQNFFPFRLPFRRRHKTDVEQRFDHLRGTVQVACPVKAAQTPETQVPQAAVRPVGDIGRQIDQVGLDHPDLELVGKADICRPRAAADVYVVTTDGKVRQHRIFCAFQPHFHAFRPFRRTRRQSEAGQIFGLVRFLFIINGVGQHRQKTGRCAPDKRRRRVPLPVSIPRLP